MKAVIYARVSSREQEESGYSLDAQIKLLQDYAQKHGYEIDRVFRVSESASGKQIRTTFNEMFQYVVRKNIDVILCEKIDRLTRNLKDAAIASDWIQEKEGRELHFVKESSVINKNTRAHENLVWDMKVAIARFYTNNLSEEVRKGQKEKLAQGWMPMRAKLGYKTIGEVGHKIHVIDEARAPHIRKMFELYATGNYSVERLSHLMHKEGLRTRDGYRLVRSRMAQLLADPYYIGKNVWGGKTFNGKHEPLISLDLFNRVQQILDRKTTPKYRKHDYLFKGLIVCEDCGGLLTWEKQKGILYGHCSQYRKCPKRAWYKESDFEEKLSQEFVSLCVVSCRLAEWARKALKELHAGEIADRTAVLNDLQTRQTRLKQKQATLYEDRLDGRISAEAYDQKSLALNEELSSLVEAFRRHSEADTAYYELGSNIFELSQQAGIIFKEAPLPKKKRLLALMYKDMRIKGGQLVVELTGPFATLARIIAGLNGSKVSEKQLSDYRIFELAQNQATKGRKGRTDPAMSALLPEQDAIISVFSDSNYMQGLYNQMLFIKAMSRQEVV